MNARVPTIPVSLSLLPLSGSMVVLCVHKHKGCSEENAGQITAG